MSRRNLTDAQRQALSERARAQHKSGSLRAKVNGSRGGKASAARRRRERDAELAEGDVAIGDAVGAYVIEVLRIARSGYHMFQVAYRDDELGPDLRADLGVQRAATPSWGQREAPEPVPEVPGDHGLLRHLGARVDWQDGEPALVPI